MLPFSRASEAPASVGEKIATLGGRVGPLPAEPLLFASFEDAIFPTVQFRMLRARSRVKRKIKWMFEIEGVISTCDSDKILRC